MTDTTPSTQTEPLYAADCWYYLEGKRNAFAARAGKAYLYPGWILVQDSETAKEVNRVPVDEHLELRHMMGSLISRKNARYPSPNPKLWLCFYKPSITLITILIMIPVLIFRLPIVLELTVLVGALVTFAVVLPPAVKTAKAFAAQVAADAATRAD